MPDLNESDILSLAKTVGIVIPPELMTEVGYTLNGTLETLASIDIPGLEEIEPLPIVIPRNTQ